MNLPFGKSSLRKAIEKGLAHGNIDEELRELGDTKVTKRADAEAICRALKQLGPDRSKEIDALARLLQEADDNDGDVLEILRMEGVPELLRLFDSIKAVENDEAHNSLLFILKIVAMYGTLDGTLKVVEAAQEPFRPKDYLWSVILKCFSADHPEKELLFRSLSDPLPPEFIAVSLLDAANSLLIAGDSMAHPFDTAEGIIRLRGWLTDADPENFSYAHSATAALPFVRESERDALLELALNHADPGVRMEAAWVEAKTLRPGGLARLTDLCRNLNSAQTAMSYLRELGREDLIPAEAKGPDFTALAEFSQWCAHPAELGRPPDELQLVDKRELPWPPERELKPFWLIRYRIHDTTGLKDDDEGVGLVGSITFCLFSTKLTERPPEDAYGMYCSWEMKHQKLLEITDIEDDAEDYCTLLRQWTGSPIEDAKLLYIAELSPQLNHPQRLIGLASGRMNGGEGWVVLDGPCSEWLPQTHQPAKAGESSILEIHIGRQLLGLTGESDRLRYLAAPKPARPLGEVVSAYERILSEARLAHSQGKDGAYRNWGPLKEHLPQYANALRATNQTERILPCIQELSPHWKNPDGYAALGKVAFTCGQPTLAEEFFIEYKTGNPSFARGEEMDMLAELWFNQGKASEARQLLRDCMRQLFEESKTAEGSDKRLIERWYQTRRATFIRLFRSEGESFLNAQGLPATTLIKG